MLFDRIGPLLSCPYSPWAGYGHTVSQGFPQTQSSAAMGGRAGVISPVRRLAYHARSVSRGRTTIPPGTPLLSRKRFLPTVCAGIGRRSLATSLTLLFILPLRYLLYSCAYSSPHLYTDCTDRSTTDRQGLRFSPISTHTHAHPLESVLAQDNLKHSSGLHAFDSDTPAQ